MRARQEVFRARRGVCGGDLVRTDARIVAAAAVGANLQVRELRLQVRCDRAVEFDILGERTTPHRVLVVVRVVLRFVPDLPVGDFHLEAVCPALGVVPDYVFADATPLGVVFGGQDVHRRVSVRHEVLDGHAQTEKRFHAIGIESFQE